MNFLSSLAVSFYLAVNSLLGISTGFERATVFERESLGSDFSRDEQHVYRGDEVVYIEWENKIKPDRESFSVVLDSEGEWTGLVKDKNNVYAIGHSSILDRLEYIDVNSFQVLGFSFIPATSPREGDPPDTDYFPLVVTYTRDADEIFGFAGIHGYAYKLESADPTTFEIIASPDGEQSIYAKDSQNIYIGNRALDVDPVTFEIVEGQEGYDAQDKNHKYHWGKVVE